MDIHTWVGGIMQFYLFWQLFFGSVPGSNLLEVLSPQNSGSWEEADRVELVPSHENTKGIGGGFTMRYVRGLASLNHEV